MDDGAPKSQDAEEPRADPVAREASPRAPFVRQVSNRVYPAGERRETVPACPACGHEQRPQARSSSRFAAAHRQSCANDACGRQLRLEGDRWRLVGS